MDEFWGKALIFAFVVALVLLLCIIQGCFSSDRQCGRPCKSLQYCSGQCQMTHWRKERKEVCQTMLNGHAIATTQQTPHFHGSGSNTSRPFDGKYKQSRKLKEADPNSLFSHGLKEVGTTVRQNYPRNHSESSMQLDRWGKPVRNPANNPKPVKHAFDNGSQVKAKAEMDRHCMKTDIPVKEAIMDVPYLGDETLSQKCANCLVHYISDRCTRCKMVFYCSSQCRKMHWRAGHKKLCDQLIRHSTTAPSRPNKSSEELRTKLQKLKKTYHKVLKENQVLQSMQHDMEKEVEHLHQQIEKFSMEFSLLRSCKEQLVTSMRSTRLEKVAMVAYTRVSFAAQKLL